MRSERARLWIASIAAGAVAFGVVVPLIDQFMGGDEQVSDWQITRGGNPDVRLAHTQARDAFPVFLAALEAADAGAGVFEVAVELPAPNGTPTKVWLENVSLAAGEVSGHLKLTPPDGLTEDLKKGDKTSFTRAQILDWRYVENGLWRGDFVVRVILSEYPEDVRARIVENMHDRPILSAPD